MSLPFLPSLPASKAEFLATMETRAIFAAACAYAEPEMTRVAEAERAAQRARDAAVLFLVWPDGLCAYTLDDGRTVYAPWHKFLGVRRCAYTNYCLDWEPAPDGAVYKTAEELGFVNDEMRAHAHDLAFNRDALYWKRLGYDCAPSAIRKRVHRVTNAIAGQIAAWHRRREALVAWRRLNPRS